MHRRTDVGDLVVRGDAGARAIGRLRDSLQCAWNLLQSYVLFIFLTLGLLPSGFAYSRMVLGISCAVIHKSSLHHLQNSTVRHIVKTETTELQEYITV